MQYSSNRTMALSVKNPEQPIDWLSDWLTDWMVDYLSKWLRLGSHLRQIFEMSEDVAYNFVSELVRDN